MASRRSKTSELVSKTYIRCLVGEIYMNDKF